MSETMTTGKLAEALAKAQAQMESASKDRTNPAFKSKYADLTSVWEACRSALTSNGLAVAQIMVAAPEGHVAVETRLLHSSGESLSSTCTLPATKKDAQGYGSAITYARRYGLSAMVGVVADDDDDGNAATGAGRRDSTPAHQHQAKPQGDAVEREEAALRTATTRPATTAKPAATPRSSSASAGVTFPNYGRARGAPVAGASMQDLEFYANGARRSLADPAKQRFHASEQKLLDAIEAEIARQSDPSNFRSEPGEPPPHTDADVPF